MLSLLSEFAAIHFNLTLGMPISADMHLISEVRVTFSIKSSFVFTFDSSILGFDHTHFGLVLGYITSSVSAVLKTKTGRARFKLAAHCPRMGAAFRNPLTLKTPLISRSVSRNGSAVE